MAPLVDRYKLALLLLAIALMPLFYVSIWLGTAAAIAVYALMARLANKDFDRQSRKHISSLPRQPKH
jgi:hypothetical protein